MDLAVPPEVPTAAISELPLFLQFNEDTLFSEHQRVEAQPSTKDPPPLPSTNESRDFHRWYFSPLLTNPSMTDMLSNFPIWPQVDQPVTNALSNASLDAIQPTSLNSTSASKHSPRQVDQKRRSRGRPPRATAVARGGLHQNKRGGVRKRGPKGLRLHFKRTSLLTPVSTDQESPPVSTLYR